MLDPCEDLSIHELSATIVTVMRVLPIVRGSDQTNEGNNSYQVRTYMLNMYHMSIYYHTSETAHN